MLKTGEADIAYVMIGLEAIAIKADPKLRLAKVIPPATWWMEFPEQWNTKSPWSDRRVRLAANLPWTSRRSTRRSGWGSHA
jgi:peptide/nickel transport system substrate-binding protein